jgi:SAM-dependent methyltransferase
MGAKKVEVNGERGRRIVPTYSESASVYDHMVGRYLFEQWVENFERLQKRCDIDITMVADVACGTGLASRYLALKGASVWAMDISLDMLRKASMATRGLGVKLLRQDMRYMTPGPRVTLLICAADSLNHLVRDIDVRRAVRSFHAALLPEGYALFDMNTVWQLRAGEDSVAWEFDVDGRPMRWVSRWEEGELTATLEFTFIANEDTVEDSVEIHRERAYDTAWILRELEIAGFNRIEALDAAGLGKVTERTRRIQFVARR